MDKSARVGTRKIVPIPKEPPIVVFNRPTYPIVFQRKTSFTGSIPDINKSFSSIRV